MASSKKLLPLVLGLSFVLSGSLALAQAKSLSGGDSLKLSDALDEGLKNSPKIQKSESVVRESEWKTTETYSGFLPTLTASASYLFDKKYVLTDVFLAGNLLSIEQVIPTSSATLTAQWSLFDGFSSTNRYHGASSMEQASKDENDWNRFQLEREIAVLFYKALAAKELKAVAEQNVKALEDHLKDVRLFKKVGVSTNFDVLRVEVQMSEAQSELLNSIDNVEVTRARLSEALGRQEDASEVEGALPRPKKELIKVVEKVDLSTRKDLVALKERSEGFKYQEASAERYWVPKISAFGQYQYYNNRNDDYEAWDSYRDAYQVGLNMTWNIFDGMSSISKSKQSVEQRYQVEKNLYQAELKAKRDYDLWKRKFLYFCSVYESRLNDISKSEESVRLAREGQKVGSRTNTDVLDAEAELFRAKAGAVNAQMGALEAMANLELSTGQQMVQYH
jgi:outer membrane protein TolC